MFMKFLSALSACRPTAAIRKPLSPIWIRASSLYATLKALYARRWGIETSFRSLKYAVGLIHLHAKKPDLVLQEIFASFLIFNFTQAAAWAVEQLDEAGQTVLAKLIESQHEIDSITALENFILGFRLGVRMMAECMDGNDGDIREVADYG